MVCASLRRASHPHGGGEWRGGQGRDDVIALLPGLHSQLEELLKRRCEGHHVVARGRRSGRDRNVVQGTECDSARGVCIMGVDAPVCGEEGLGCEVEFVSMCRVWRLCRVHFVAEVDNNGRNHPDIPGESGSEV